VKRALLLALVACTGAAAKGDKKSTPVTRDWSAHPAIVELDDADEIFAVSDPHGGATTLATLLAANHVIASADKPEWTAGKAILVVPGDMIDKGPDSLGVIDLLRALEPKAKAKGGRVIVTLGNHEAEFFADPHNKKASGADGIAAQLADKKLSPDDVAAGSDAAGRGRWMMDLPFAVRIKKWFFAHGGNTNGDSLAALAKRLQQGFDKHGFSDDDITGKNSVLEAQQWYGNQNKDDAGKAYADALGVKHIVFGHDPGAFGEHGHILASKNGVLVKLDVNGVLMLHIKTKGDDTAEVLDTHGKAQPLL
jgi:hypothetical protein